MCKAYNVCERYVFQNYKTLMIEIREDLNRCGFGWKAPIL